MDAELDIVIPVYNEGASILATLGALVRELKTPARVLICYDLPDDDTLPAVQNNAPAFAAIPLEFVKNPGRTRRCLPALPQARRPTSWCFPPMTISTQASSIRWWRWQRRGSDIVCASRFMPGGKMEGCPWLKAVLVRSAAFMLHRFAGLPTHDATSGFRLFSRRTIERIAIESDQGFLLQHRAAGESPSAGLENIGSSRGVV
jgi:hypothetical protein